jgi:hypothetical protein
MKEVREIFSLLGLPIRFVLGVACAVFLALLTVAILILAPAAKFDITEDFVKLYYWIGGAVSQSTDGQEPKK